MPSSPAAHLDRSPKAGTAAKLVLADMLRLPDGSAAEHRLMAMASDLWAECPEANDPAWIAAEFNGLTIAYQITT